MASSLFTLKRLKALLTVILYGVDVCTDIFVGIQLALACHYNYMAAVFTLCALPGIFGSPFIYAVLRKDYDWPCYAVGLAILFAPISMVLITAWVLIQALVKQDNDSMERSKVFKTTEVAFESFPQLLSNLFIIMSLQKNEPLNWISTSASFASVLYGVSDYIASFKHGIDVPFMKVVWAVLAAFLDVTFGLFLTAYIFTLYKAYGFVFPSTSLLVTLIATCILWKKRPRGQSQEILKCIFSFFISFASSAIWCIGTFKAFITRKAIKNLIAAIALSYITLVFMTIDEGKPIFVETFGNFNHSLNISCDNICSNSAKEACQQLSLPMETHSSIIVTLWVLFGLIVIEMILETFFEWMPIRKVMKKNNDTEDGDNDEPMPEPVEMAPLNVL